MAMDINQHPWVRSALTVPLIPMEQCGIMAEMIEVEDEQNEGKKKQMMMVTICTPTGVISATFTQDVWGQFLAGAVNAFREWQKQGGPIKVADLSDMKAVIQQMQQKPGGNGRVPKGPNS